MYVFDLDQTLRDNTDSGHMVPEDMTRAENWIPWTKYVSERSPAIPRMITIYKALLNSGQRVIILTSSSMGTAKWLEINGIPEPDAIYERPLDCDLSPSAYKKQWIAENKEDIQLWVDDDPRVCEHVRSLDIDVLQVWLPDGHPLKQG
ncbi:hypothetical protein [Vibrio phage BONAISHI]|nr:hypothetical protein [Vibrio phage BONAISHI]